MAMRPRRDEPAERTGERKSRLRDALKVGFGFILLLALLLTADLGRVRESFALAEMRYLGYVVLAFLLLLGLQALRFHLLVGSITERFRTTLRVVLVGFFFNNFLPSTVGGDIYKIVAVGAQERQWSASTALVLLDRLSGLVVAILIGSAAVLWGVGHPEILSLVEAGDRWSQSVVVLIAGALLMAIGGWILWRFGESWIGRRLVPAVQAGWVALREIPGRTLLGVLSLSAAAFAARVFRFVLYAKFFGFQLPLAELTLVVVILTLVGLVPLSVGGLGIQEGTIAAGMALFGVPLGLGTAVAVLNRAATWVIALLGGGLWIVARNERRTEE